MKKNRAMRAAGGLLIATLLSTSAVSGTFAKYVSKGSAGDTARVAKWGVVITGSGNLFSKNYLNGTTNTPTTSTTANAISVESSNTDMLVAPGTKSDTTGLSFGITGKPEVDTRVKATIEAKDVYLAAGTYAVMKKVAVNSDTFTGKVTSGIYTKSGTAYTKVASTAAFDSSATYYEIDTDTDAVVATGGYYPVVFTYTGDGSAHTANAVAAAVAAALNGGTAVTGTTASGTTTYTLSKNYDSNTDLGTALATDDEKITWEWIYNNEIDTTWDNVDFEDTILGDLAAGTEVVSVGDGGAVTVLSVDGTTGVVTAGSTEVGCIRTTFNVSIEAVQID